MKEQCTNSELMKKVQSYVMVHKEIQHIPLPVISEYLSNKLLNAEENRENIYSISGYEYP